MSDVEVNSDGSSYSLPLCITKPLSSLSLHLEIRGTTPVVRDADEAFAGLKFTATGNDFVSDVQLEQFKSKKNLLIGLGAQRQEEASSLSNTFDGECYFLVHDVPAESHDNSSVEKCAPINHVAVVWDSSLSMETVSKKRVLKVLGDLYADDALKVCFFPLEIGTFFHSSDMASIVERKDFSHSVPSSDGKVAAMR